MQQLCFKIFRSFYSTANLAEEWLKMGDESEKFGVFKQLAFKVRKAMNNVDSTELPKEIQEKCTAFEDYRQTLIQVNEALLLILMGNPKCTPAATSQQVLDYPAGTAPFETFEKAVKNMKMFWYEDALIQDCRKESKDALAKHREIRDRARRQIHQIRSFINHMFTEYEKLKTELLIAKDQKDIAADDLKKGETAGRQNKLKKCTEKYEKELAVLEKYVGSTFADQRVKHIEELECFMQEIETLHRWFASFAAEVKKRPIRRPTN